MKSALRNLVVWALCAGILVPVVAVTDDIVLLAAAIQELTSSRPLEVRGNFHANPSDSSVVFWTQFEHMDFQTVSETVPEIGRTSVVACPEHSFVSLHVTETSVRGPPLTIAS